ncbi:diguanylate cyclase [Sulfurimonas sp.]|uniref:GGDEF domain-containing response regulator n=1 Tax=Sulfurimonas sp. TaxID=2022749 RepID=UPI002AB13357|nr:diguanylate cyclase [Sulfurimonas sp.]
MRNVLVVNDNQNVLSSLKQEFKKQDDIKPYFAKSHKEANDLLNKHHDKFHAALLDIYLNDAKNGEIIELINHHNIPYVILTDMIDGKIQDTLLKKNIINIFSTNDQTNIACAVTDISRTLKNYDTTILIVDDSDIYRKILKDSLKKIKLKIIEACDGVEALEILENNNKISLVLTDYEMPNMDGIELTFKLRKKYKKDQLGIIALSVVEEQNVISKFLRIGANDFINKRFTHNELVTRINANLELLDLFAQIKEMANKDFLTGAYNRRFFFDNGNSIYSKNKRKNTPLTVAMIDIDKFKNINDTYGHDTGDVAIKEAKRILVDNLRDSDLMARFGGEEFCVLLEDITYENTRLLFEKIRNKFQNNIIRTHKHVITYTVSIGIYIGLSDSLEDMIRLSDEALYEAKENGRNRIIISQ